MKKVLLFALAAFALVSCKKEKNGGSPSSDINAGTYDALTIKARGQVVKLSVKSNILNLVYNEDVTLIMDQAKLNSSLAVHLKEDFTGSQLAKYDYRSLTEEGVDATNWVDDNLNNIVTESSKDTLINNRMFVKRRITRAFVYQKSFSSAADATVEMNQLLKQTDIITFSAYYAPVDPEVATTVNTAKLTYEKM